jgi:hypothetical protein
LIGLLGHVVTVPTIAPTLATMIGLGVGIDYAPSWSAGIAPNEGKG